VRVLIALAFLAFEKLRFRFCFAKNMANPALPDIYSVGRYAEGQWFNDVNSIGGPSVPSTTWEPSTNPFGQVATDMLNAWMNGGAPPKSTMGVDIKAFDFIQRQYMCSPYHDESNRLIMPEMLCFTVNYYDPQTGSVQVLTLSKVNQILHEHWEEFMESVFSNGLNFSQRNKDFYDLLATYGEQGLENFHYADRNGHAEDFYSGKELSDLRKFRDMALEDDYHWLTKFGILRHISFAGAVINTTRAVGLETMDNTAHSDHYTQVNVCLAKRGRVANVFGPASRIKTGSKLWMVLRRKSRPSGLGPGPFCIVPGGSHIYDYPLAGELEFEDINKKTVRGHFWRVGVVLRGADDSPATVAIQRASNLGLYCSERAAYEVHGTLPTLYVALGFKF
jgi:hypothetical protein